jgi:hypothetical protein
MDDAAGLADAQRRERFVGLLGLTFLVASLDN